MQDSKLPLSKWAIAFYLYSTNLKGMSSMKLHRDLGITQKSAWHLAQRIRETWDDATDRFTGTVEVYETYIGGSERNNRLETRVNALENELQQLKKGDIAREEFRHRPTLMIQTARGWRMSDWINILKSEDDILDRCLRGLMHPLTR